MKKENYLYRAEHSDNRRELSQLSDSEILQGFKDADAQIVKEYL